MNNRLSGSSPLSPDYECFLACCEVKNFLRASEILQTQQSSVTKAIQRLEKSLGETLFIRSTRGVELTAQGERVRRALSNALQSWDSQFRLEPQKASDFEGILRVGAHTAMASARFFDLISQITHKFPKVKVDLVFDHSLALMNRLEKGELDLCHSFPLSKSSQIQQKKIGAEDFSLYASSRKFSSVKLPSSKSLHSLKDARLLWHPSIEFIFHEEFKLSSLNWVQVPDYGALVKLLLENPSYLGILPRSLIQNSKLFEISKLKTIDAVLFWKKQPNTKTPLSKILDLCF